MSLINYVTDESDGRREEKMNSEYIGKMVWVRAEIIEVAAEQSGQVLLNVDAVDDEGDDTDLSFLMTTDSDDLKVADEDDKLIDG